MTTIAAASVNGVHALAADGRHLVGLEIIGDRRHDRRYAARVVGGMRWREPVRDPPQEAVAQPLLRGAGG